MHIPDTLLLIGNRVTLKLSSSRYDDAVRVMLSDLTTMKHQRYMTHEPHGWTLEEVADRRLNFDFARKRGDALLMDVICRSTGEFIGQSGYPMLDQRHKQALGGLIYHHPFHRKGYATEAQLLIMEYLFETLQLHKLVYDTLEENTETKPFFEKYGIPLECVRKDALLDRGEYKHVADYVVFSHTWPAIKARMKAAIATKS